MPQNRYRNGQAIVTPPTAYPVTLTEVKEQLKCGDDEDNVLNRYIATATSYTETYLSRSLMEQTWDVYYDQFPPLDNAITLPDPPLISVTYIHYWDQDSVEQTWDSAEYVVDTAKKYGGLVYPQIGYSYPNTRFFPKSVVIRTVSGYQSGASPAIGDNIPEETRQAILYLIGHMFENREPTVAAIMINEVPRTYSAMLANEKVRGFG